MPCAPAPRACGRSLTGRASEPASGESRPDASRPSTAATLHACPRPRPRPMPVRSKPRRSGHPGSSCSSRGPRLCPSRIRWARRSARIPPSSPERRRAGSWCGCGPACTWSAWPGRRCRPGSGTCCGSARSPGSPRAPVALGGASAAAVHALPRLAPWPLHVTLLDVPDLPPGDARRAPRGEGAAGAGSVEQARRAPGRCRGRRGGRPRGVDRPWGRCGDGAGAAGRRLSRAGSRAARAGLAAAAGRAPDPRGGPGRSPRRRVLRGGGSGGRGVARRRGDREGRAGGRAAACAPSARGARARAASVAPCRVGACGSGPRPVAQEPAARLCE